MKRDALLRIIVMLSIIFGSFYILKETYLDCKNLTQLFQNSKEKQGSESNTDKKSIYNISPFSRFIISLW